MANILLYILVILMEVLDDKLSFIKKTIDTTFNVQKWFQQYVVLLDKYILKRSVFNGILGLVAVVIITIFGLGIIEFILHLILRAVGVYIFVLAVLCLCFGSSYVDKNSSNFVYMNEKLFALLFWFMLFGSKGWIFAVTYWLLIALPKEVRNLSGDYANLLAITQKVHGYAAWIPARITGLIYALAGNFSTAYKVWLESIKHLEMPSTVVLTTCGEGAMSNATDVAKEQALIKRAVIIWCVLGTFFALII